jgi:hypothetical protein
MTTFIEKIAVEIVVSLCVGAVLGLISGLMSMPDGALRQNQRPVCRRCGSEAMTESAPDQLLSGDEHQ